MTDRARVAALPDEAPIEELPLPRSTINRLRVAGVLTLGDLRAASDRALLRLRHFGSHSLADVRFLVPPPGGSVASAGGEVTIAGRTFTLGTVYMRHPGPGPSGARPPRRLLGYSADSVLSGGRVRVSLPSGARRVMTGTAWAAWAGEPVEDSLEDVGR